MLLMGTFCGWLNPPLCNTGRAAYEASKLKRRSGIVDGGIIDDPYGSFKTENALREAPLLSCGSIIIPFELPFEGCIGGRSEIARPAY
jgi:hypothetical protein